MNRHVHLTGALPLSASVTFEGRGAEVSPAHFAGLLAFGAITPWDPEGGKIRGFSLRVSSENPDDIVIRDFWQDQFSEWGDDGNRVSSCCVSFGCYDPRTGEEFAIDLSYFGEKFEFRTGPLTTVLVFHGMNEDWFGQLALGALSVNEEARRDRSVAIDSVPSDDAFVASSNEGPRMGISLLDVAILDDDGRECP